MKKVLIANRGEIALRVQRSCDRMGIKSVIIQSEADMNSYTARMAHEVYCIGKASPSDSYLHIEKIVAAARELQCDAVHPGYGFLSENASFARAVEDAGLIFIGPASETIRLLGSKTDARNCLRKEGVPLTEGAPAGLSDQELLTRADAIGYPVIVKAVAGGGGRGMRVAKNAAELKDAIPRARGEAKKFFSNEDVYLEQYIENPRHVEVQVFGDATGKVVHFGTRDCSAQRRHQKIVEEAPAPFLEPELRAAIEGAAVTAAQAVNYVNAGTAEFLVSGDRFYFLEMNTRIQVEHPVTEMVARVSGRPYGEDGIDLVSLQLEVARGESFPFTQADISFEGHAFEYRVYAEDPLQGFIPARGTIKQLSCPAYPWVREDKAYEEGDSINVFYDAMMSKIIVYGTTRDEAIARSRKLFQEYKLSGVDTTLPFHKWILLQEPFVRDGIDIGFVERLCTKEAIEEVLSVPYAQGSSGERVEVYRLKSDHFGYTLPVEFRFRQDSLIHAVPVFEGKECSIEFQRSSYCLNSLIDTMKTDVLERVPLKDIFS